MQSASDPNRSERARRKAGPGERAVGVYDQPERKKLPIILLGAVAVVLALVLILLLR